MLAQTSVSVYAWECMHVHLSQCVRVHYMHVSVNVCVGVCVRVCLSVAYGGRQHLCVVGSPYIYSLVRCTRSSWKQPVAKVLLPLISPLPRLCTILAHRAPSHKHRHQYVLTNIC